MQRYNITKILGDGTYGSVWMGKNKESGELVAIKTLKRKFTTWDQCITLRELRCLQSLPRDANIVQIKELIREDDFQVHFVFEYMPDGNLYQAMKEAQIRKKSNRYSSLFGSNSNDKSKMNFTPERIKSIVHQIVKGLDHIHSLGFIHRDIKPENLMLNGDVCKIADFGLARKPKLHPNAPSLTAYISTRWYRAPEVLLKHSNYSAKIDVFAVGLVMAEMIELKPLCPGSSEIDQIYKVFALLGQPTHANWPEGVQLLDKMKLPLNVASPVSIAENSKVSFASRHQGDFDPSMNNLYRALPSASPEMLVFVHSLLRMNPTHRLSAREAARDRYFVSGDKTNLAEQLGKDSCTNMEAEAVRQARRNKSRVIQCARSSSNFDIANHSIANHSNTNMYSSLAQNLVLSQQTQNHRIGQQLEPQLMNTISACKAVTQKFGMNHLQTQNKCPNSSLRGNISQRKEANPFSRCDNLFLGNYNDSDQKPMCLSGD